MKHGVGEPGMVRGKAAVSVHLQRSVWPAGSAHWTERWAESGAWEPGLGSGTGSGPGVKGADLFRWVTPQVLVSTGLGLGRRSGGWHLGSGWGWSSGLDVMMGASSRRKGDLILHPAESAPCPPPSCTAPGTSAAALDLSPRL